MQTANIHDFECELKIARAFSSGGVRSRKSLCRFVILSLCERQTDICALLTLKNVSTADHKPCRRHPFE